MPSHFLNSLTHPTADGLFRAPMPATNLGARFAVQEPRHQNLAQRGCYPVQCLLDVIDEPRVLLPFIKRNIRHDIAQSRRIASVIRKRSFQGNNSAFSESPGPMLATVTIPPEIPGDHVQI